MGTMSIAAAADVKTFGVASGFKILSVKVTGSSSYATGGDTIDFSTANAQLGQAFGFQKVYGVVFAGQDTAADTVFYPSYIPAAADAPATAKIKFNDLSAAADAEVANATNLSTKTWRFVVFGS